MKLKIKSLNLVAGRPIVFINKNDAETLNVHVGERVIISKNKKKIIAIVDIVKGMIERGQVGVSQEIIKNLKTKSHETVDVGLTLIPKSIKIILKKMAGKPLTKSEIELIVKDIVTNALTEAEIAYFVSSVYFK